MPIPSDLKDSVVRAYPDGKMKAVVISLDDGADWCYESDKRAMAFTQADEVVEFIKTHQEYFKD